MATSSSDQARLLEPDLGMSLKGPKAPWTSQDAAALHPQALPVGPPLPLTARSGATAASQGMEITSSTQSFQKSQTEYSASSLPPVAQDPPGSDEESVGPYDRFLPEPEVMEVDPPEPFAPLPPEGPLVGLGWQGNVYTTDPQYSADGSAADAAAHSQAATGSSLGLYLAVLGDMGSEIRLPEYV